MNFLTMGQAGELHAHLCFKTGKGCCIGNKGDGVEGSGFRVGVYGFRIFLHGCNGRVFERCRTWMKCGRESNFKTTTTAVQGGCVRLLKLTGLHDLIVKCLRMGFFAAASFLTKCCRAV